MNTAQIPPSADVPMPDTLAGPLDVSGNPVAPSNMTRALISMSGEVAYNKANGLDDYDPYDDGSEDDPAKRLEFLQVERDEAGNVIRVVKPDPVIVEYDHREKAGGDNFPDGTSKWKFDDSRAPLSSEQINPMTGVDDPSILPRMHVSERGRRIAHNPASKPYQATHMHIENFSPDARTWRTIAGRTNPKTGKPNTKFYVSSRRRSEMLYGDPVHPEKSGWKMEDDALIYDLIMEDLKHEPQIPMTMNFAEAEAAKPYVVNKVVIPDPVNGGVKEVEAGRDPAPGELRPDEYDYFQIKIDKYLDHLLEDAHKNGRPAPTVEEMQAAIARLRTYAREYMEMEARRDPRLETFADEELNHYLKFEMAEEQKGELNNAVKFAEMVYAYAERRLTDGGFEDLETKVLVETQKRVDGTVHSGPDDKYRILFSVENSNGVWVRSDTNEPLTESEVLRVENLYKILLKDANSMAEYQAACAYEITKQPPYLQAIFWQRMINTQMERGFTPQQVAMIMIGLQYANKPLYLSLKHRSMINPLARDKNGIVIFEDVLDKKKRTMWEDLDGNPVSQDEEILEDVNPRIDSKTGDWLGYYYLKKNKKGEYIKDKSGNPKKFYLKTKDRVEVDPDTGLRRVIEHERVVKRRAKVDKTRIVIGPLQLKKWITEAAYRLPIHGMRFEALEVKSLNDIAIMVMNELDRSFYLPGYVPGRGFDEFGYKRTSKGRLSEGFLDALFCLKGMRAMANNMVMGSTQDIDTGAKGDERAQMIAAATAEQQALSRAGIKYPPRIAGASIPHENLQPFCDLVEEGVKRYPIVTKYNLSDKGTMSAHDLPIGRTRR